MSEQAQEIDALIVGQGLAGSVVARRLMDRGWKVHILDTHQKSAASRVAAGMVNPIVFKRLNKTWETDRCMPIALEFFQAWEKELELKVWHPTPIVRLFPDQQAATDFVVKSEAPGFRDWLKTDSCSDGDSLEAPFGYGRVEGVGYLELGVLLDAVRQRWMDAGLLTEGSFDEAHITHGDRLGYGNWSAKHLILCQGHQLLDGELFGALPLRRTKGEVVDVEVPGLERDHIINNGRWAIPLGNNRYRLGATYLWHTSNTETTKEGRDLLLNRLGPVLGAVGQVLDQRAGIRPAAKDRRPLIGTHPDHKNVHVFNGLGARGVMISPWLAGMFADYLEGKASLAQEVDIRRFADETV